MRIMTPEPGLRRRFEGHRSPRNGSSACEESHAPPNLYAYLCSLAPDIWQENFLYVVFMLNEYLRDVLIDFFYCVE